ncbi:MAG: gamma-glutamyltransferase, partial [Bryobacteraceae bacterium]
MIRFFLLVAAAPLFAQPPMAPSFYPPVRGTREMVGAANNFEVEAGYRMLMQGGNAIDAGVSSVLSAAVTEQARFGLGGEMPLLVKMAGKPVIAISAIGVAPVKATVEYYKSRSPEPWEDGSRIAPIPSHGVRAAITPGVFDGLILALDKYGTMPFAKIAEPAIEQADGFPMGEEFANFIRAGQRYLELWPVSKAFFMPNGFPKRGEIFRQPALARTLRDLVEAERKTRGNRSRKLQAVRDYFFRGPVARKIGQASQEMGGLLAYEDLAGYKAETDEPASTTYRGYTVYKTGFWAQGPVLLQALNILEGFDLKA